MKSQHLVRPFNGIILIYLSRFTERKNRENVRLTFPEGYLCMSTELSPWVTHNVLLDDFVDEKTEVLYDQNEIVRRSIRTMLYCQIYGGL